MSRRHSQHAIRARHSEPRPKKIANGFSALQILLFREENSRQSRSLHSHSSFLRRSFFAVRAGLADSGIGLQRTWSHEIKSGSSVTLANEADRSNILASGLLVRTFFGLTFFPPSPLSEHRLQVCVPLQRLARGKSYPVTAAQLLRFHTGFLAPIHCFKLAKN